GQTHCTAGVRQRNGAGSRSRAGNAEVVCSRAAYIYILERISPGAKVNVGGTGQQRRINRHAGQVTKAGVSPAATAAQTVARTQTNGAAVIGYGYCSGRRRVGYYKSRIVAVNA